MTLTDDEKDALMSVDDRARDLLRGPNRWPASSSWASRHVPWAPASVGGADSWMTRSK